MSDCPSMPRLSFQRNLLAACWLVALSASGSVTQLAAQEPPTPKRPAHQRQLDEAQTKRVADLSQQVQEAILRQDYDSAEQRANEIAQIRAKAQGADHWETAGARRLVVHLKQYKAWSPAELNEFAKSITAYSEGSKLYSQQQFAPARKQFEAALDRRARLLPKTDPHVLRCQQKIGACLSMERQFVKAEVQLRAATEAMRKEFGEYDPDTAGSQGDLGLCLYLMGRPRDAAEAFQKQVEIHEEIYGGDHINTGQAVLMLAHAMESGNRFDLAEIHFRRTLAIDETHFGKDSVQLVQRHADLAFALDELGKAPEAAAHFQTAWNIAKSALGENSPAAVRALGNLASHHQQFGDRAEAVRLYSQVVDLQKNLSKTDDLDLAKAHADLGSALKSQQKFREALGHFESSLAIRQKLLGKKHHLTGKTAGEAARMSSKLGKHQAALATFESALAADQAPDVLGVRERVHLLGEHAKNLESLGRIADAEQPYRDALALAEKSLGKNHGETLLAEQVLLFHLRRQRKHEEADALSDGLKRRLLDSESELDDMDRALACGSLSLSFQRQGRHDEALPFQEEAAHIWRKLRGENDHITRGAVTGVATCYYNQGRFSEAASIWEGQLEIDIKAHGPISAATYEGFQRITGCMVPLGQWARAEEFAQRQIEILEQLGVRGGDEWLDANWSKAIALGKLGNADAELSIYREILPALTKRLDQIAPSELDTSSRVNQLAQIHFRLGNFDESLAFAKQSIARVENEFGENSSIVAGTRANFATIAGRAGRLKEAEEQWSRAVKSARERLGNENPTTHRYLSELGLNLYAQDRIAEAGDLWTEAADGSDEALLRISPAGLDRSAVTADYVRREFLAASLADRGNFDEAARRLEEHLGRGLLDEIAVRRNRELTPTDERRQSDVLSGLRELNQQLEQLADVVLTPENGEALRAMRERLEADRIRLEREWKGLQMEFAKRYGNTITKPYSLEAIQRQLLPDEALLAWIDLDTSAHTIPAKEEHWGMVIRAKGTPAWIRIPGSGPAGQWTLDDRDLLNQFRMQVAKPSPTLADKRLISALAEEVHAQRLAPLKKSLGATSDLPEVKHLIVLNSLLMNGIPLAAVTDEYTISRIPSGTILAMLRERGPVRIDALRLLAVGNPAFTSRTAAPLTKTVTPPDHGVFVQQVGNPSSAQQAGLKADDILLEYGDSRLAGGDDLLKAIGSHTPKAGVPPKQLPLKVWRDGKELELKIPQGTMGIAFSRTAAKANWLAAVRARTTLRSSRRDRELEPLPATRFELESIEKTFRKSGGESLVLQQDSASEQRVAAMADAGELDDYNFLHFATHAIVNDASPWKSALMFSEYQSQPARLETLLSQTYDGRITAEQILRGWDLNCELVALSACETGLGQELPGEGIIGFSSALLLAGARNVLVSLWPVDDGATALLMGRFYENLLKQQRKQASLDKARALAEAQRWLKNLSRAEAQQRLGGAGQVVHLPDSDQPYSHPSYWAAFTLIGEARR